MLIVRKLSVGKLEAVGKALKAAETEIPMRVLVVEDDRSLCEFLRRGMEREGHRVDWAADGDAALAQAGAEHPDLILLDLSLPRRDGMEVLAEMRKQHVDSAVLVLSGRNDVQVRVQCLDMGADDYLLKPFNFVELTARCRALLRRRAQFADPVLRCGDLALSRVEHKVSRAGRTISLTAKEFVLLEFLMQHQGECVTRIQLLAEVWQTQEETGTNLVDVYVNYLRRKVNGADEVPLIETVRGAGYRLGGAARSAPKRPVQSVREATRAACA